MAAVLRTAEVEWTGSILGGAGRVSGGSGAITDLPYTVASRIGQPEAETSPEELLAAAHAACFTLAIGAILARQGTPPQRLHVAATVTLKVSGRPTITSSQLDVHGQVPGADPAIFGRAAREAEVMCAVSRALQGNVEIRVRTALDEPSGSPAAHGTG